MGLLDWNLEKKNRILMQLGVAKVEGTQQTYPTITKLK